MKKLPEHIVAQILELGPYFMNTELAEMFNIKRSTINGIMFRNKVVKDPIVIKKREESRMIGAYKKGHRPFNKGQKMPEHVYERANGTMFKPGQVPHNVKPIGYERIDKKDGFIYIKTADHKPMTLKSRYLWELHHGPIPKSMVIRYKDGNKLNCTIDNLYITKRGNLMKDNQKHYPTDIKSSQIIITKIKNFIKNAEKQD